MPRWTQITRQSLHGASNANAIKMKTQILILIGWFIWAVPTAVHAQFDFSTNSDNTITVTGYSGTNNVIVVPNVIDGFPVTAIGVTAFQFSGLTSITVTREPDAHVDWNFNRGPIQISGGNDHIQIFTTLSGGGRLVPPDLKPQFRGSVSADTTLAIKDDYTFFPKLKLDAHLDQVKLGFLNLTGLVLISRSNSTLLA